jgi:hypothetical protein
LPDRRPQRSGASVIVQPVVSPQCLKTCGSGTVLYSSAIAVIRARTLVVAAPVTKPTTFADVDEPS